MSKEAALDTPPADAGIAYVKEPPAQLATLARDLIVRSKTNPRTHFDPAYIQELRSSFKDHGILQPLLVRPLPASRMQDTFEDRAPGAPLPTHEIVCGECRWRGSEGVLDELPVLIRHLDDLQVLQVQLVENLKRRDLHPIEEAEGFERLINDHKLTVDDIAARVDKSASQIYKTLKLLELTKECRDELYQGNLTRSTALLVARAPAYLQVQIAKDIMKPDYTGEPMSFRKAVQHIQQHYMLQLANAVFDIKDANLVKKAGACGSCAKNTGANGDMFDDVPGAASCTDPKCFDGKKEAHYAAVAKAAEAKGQTVIQGKEAKELVRFEGATPTGYQLLDSHEYINGKSTTLRKLLGKDGPTPILIIDPHTKQAKEMLPVDVASKVIKKAAAEGKKAAKDKEPSARDLEQKFADAWQGKAVEGIHGVIMSGARPMGITVAIARHIAEGYADMLGYGAPTERFARLFGVESVKVGRGAGVRDFIKTCPDSMVGPALLVLLLEGEFDSLYGSNQDTPVLDLLAADAGIDVDALKAQAKEEMREAAEARKAESKGKAAKPAAKASGHVSKKPKAPKTTTAEAKAGISQAFAEVDRTATPGGDWLVDNVTPQLLAKLTEHDILTRDDLADMAVDELVDVAGTMPDGGLTEDDAKALIMKAREQWFAGSMGAASTAFTVGQRVRFKEGLKGPQGNARKVSGREGTVDVVNGDNYGVRFSKKPSDYANGKADELEAIEGAAPAPIKTKTTAGGQPVDNPALAAWPFPIAPAKAAKAKKGAAA